MRNAIWLAVLATSAHAGALESYSTLETAAKAALIDAERLTADFEAGGAIYQCGAVYAYIAPVTQNKRGRVDIPVFELGECKLAGLYHTHPEGDSRFSANDVRGICKRQTVGFIKPKGGAVRMFDCRDLEAPAIRAALTDAPVSRGKEI